MVPRNRGAVHLGGIKSPAAVGKHLVIEGRNGQMPRMPQQYQWPGIAFAMTIFPNVRSRQVLMRQVMVRSQQEPIHTVGS